jgi:DNA-directed RNA polymerase sigma subunit (sigma70/sigma32)
VSIERVRQIEDRALRKLLLSKTSSAREAFLSSDRGTARVTSTT